MRAYRLAYDGRPFHGFQRQPSVPTVEDALFDALTALGATDGGPPDGYAAAGRTDAGVSAAAQVVAFEGPDWLDASALNAELPGSVRAWATADVPADFHATHHATARAYRYHLCAPDADDDRAAAAADRLDGRHDFHNLTPADENTTRGLSVRCRRDGDFLVLDLRAPGFVHELCRRVATVVRSVGTGARDAAWVDRLLGPDPVDGPDGVPPAAPEPLLLVDVTYPDATFTTDPDAAADARERFATRRADHRSLARVAGGVVDRLGD